MEIVKLDDESRTGVQNIDDQHGELIDILNRLHESMLQDTDRSTLEELVSQLVEQTRAHFSFEEVLMTRYEYPDYARHKKEHDKLLEHILDFSKRFARGDLLLTFGIMVDLKGWAEVHIRKCDKLLGAYLNEKGVF
jgi:hemerythrin